MNISKMTFSRIELVHIIKSLFVISLVFTISNFSRDYFVILFIISLLTVGIGFLFHELAHKYFAQRFGCYAEYRSDERNLLFSLLLSFTGFVFLAPGAVFIHGHVDNKKRGIISVAGPVMNIAIALFFFMFSFFVSEGIFLTFFRYGFNINSFLSFFNMIPIGNFDGKKVLKWDKKIYFLVLGSSIILTYLVPF